MSTDLKPELREERDGPAVERQRRALVTELRRTKRGGRSRTRRALVVIPAMGVLAAGAYAVTRDSQPPTDFVGCYPTASRQATSTASANHDGNDPVGDCRRAWRRGEVTGHKTRPPALVACSKGGEIRVYPGARPALCSRLGLDAVRADYASAAARNRRLEQNLERALAPCIPVAAARRVARREMDRAGHRDWALDGPDGPPPAGRPQCVGSYGIGSSEGDDGEQDPPSIILEYGSLEPTGRDRRAFEAENRAGRRERCRAGREPSAAGALARVECDLESDRCKDPRRVATALRAELRRRGLATRVALDLDVPGRCWDDTVPLDARGQPIETFDRGDRPSVLRLLSIPQ